MGSIFLERVRQGELRLVGTPYGTRFGAEEELVPVHVAKHLKPGALLSNMSEQVARALPQGVYQGVGYIFETAPPQRVVDCLSEMANGVFGPNRTGYVDVRILTQVEAAHWGEHDQIAARTTGQGSNNKLKARLARWLQTREGTLKRWRAESVAETEIADRICAELGERNTPATLTNLTRYLWALAPR